MAVHLRAVLLFSLMASPVLGIFHFSGRIRCKDNMLSIIKVDTFAKFALSVNYCGTFKLESSPKLADAGEFEFSCYDGALPTKFYTPIVYIYHACHGQCRVVKLVNQFHISLDLENEGERRDDKTCVRKF
ncbi:unnamed protein product [Bursaphelenchus xylophilus]|uniref:(pine wood nematode) hypothetical protein n=1 Tax=Bursaphelenchus xylophilus TaxID=6326 RepID=A0A1I7SIC5_BURXY|nr:unnamed protein product [Bursaphelenchus xylophilus]CAD5208586.1 unnamed protein product [Bursaphelenchus xylophilus]CAG9082070.1 unnamed protein product [Bursaphelenchus xylophilus]CAG9082090.1 unnamed protein product [Bursaphelenchus xylophilus]